MQLFVKSGDLHTLNVIGTETVADIKQKVAALESLSLPDIAMYCCGRPLEDNEVISMFAEEQSTLDVEVRLLGGNLAIVNSSLGLVQKRTSREWFVGLGLGLELGLGLGC